MWLHTDSPDLFVSLDLFFIYFQKFVFDFVRFLAMWVGGYYLIIICIFSQNNLGKNCPISHFDVKFYEDRWFQIREKGWRGCKATLFEKKEFFVFRCVLASLYEGFFVCMSVSPFVRMSVSTSKPTKTAQNRRKTLWSHAELLRTHLFARPGLFSVIW